MKTILNSILAEFTLRRVIAGFVFLPLLAFALQPFPELSLPFLSRLVFWSGVTALAIAATWAARRISCNWFRKLELSRRDLAVIPVILVLFLPCLWVMVWLLFAAQGAQSPGFLPVASYGALFATGLLITRSPMPEAPGEIAVQPRLTRRLPKGFSGQIYRLAVRDHSVDVVTSEGTFTIRSRLSDAIDEMEPVLGYCTHRSHWVVGSAIAGVEKHGGKTFLRLENGDLVPISRKYKPMLEQQGIV
ncbi:LytTR family DNA-binding domain-containing protein [Ruegeria lacuscaerulensis]|uniref:LytTR family DNA-binding domain-containing protein n=1 Tax=Ruegeria lacuscaerulensis TaxID=55218 RepID=UPI001480C76A|nr:LytTR family DNA-binding domain-containing protein [Ruegeria lacuscaerulensis]